MKTGEFFKIGVSAFKLENNELKVLRDVPQGHSGDFILEGKWVKATPQSCGGDKVFRLAQERTTDL